MLDAEEIRWVRSTANEMNNLLLVITESAQFLEDVCGPDSDTRKYFEMLRDALERAAQTTRGMGKRIGEYEQAGNAETISPPVQYETVAPLLPRPEVRHVAKPDEKPAGSPGEVQMMSLSDIEVANPEGPKELIMIVDDEEAVVFLTKRVLGGDGYRVIGASGGHESLKIYKRLKEKIALVILDFEMPVMNGIQVLGQLRFMNPGVCVVMSTGVAGQEKMREMLAKGVKGFIPKPYTPQKLLLQVRFTLDTAKKTG